MVPVLVLFLGLLAVATAQETAPVDGFVPRTFRSAAGELPYRLFVPKGYDAARSYPLVLYLHGGGGVGRDNVAQISGGNRPGTRLWISADLQARHPNFVLVPQAVDKAWPPRAELVVDLIASLRREFNLDGSRLYVTGQSMGGFGTWDVILRWPGLFAAAVPLCGGGRPAAVEAIRHLPIWVFHGALDQTVSVDRSREMVEALRKIGSQVKYTEYPSVGHDVWIRAYGEPELVEWLFAQRRRDLSDKN
jgi:predicted peptidase